MGVKAMTELELIREIQKKGVHSAAFVDTVKVPFDPNLRKYCTPQACGSYGKNWGCPPAVGDIYDLIQRAKQYKRTLVYETVAQLEDSFDYYASDPQFYGKRPDSAFCGWLHRL